MVNRVNDALLVIQAERAERVKAEEERNRLEARRVHEKRLAELAHACRAREVSRAAGIGGKNFLERSTVRPAAPAVRAEAPFSPPPQHQPELQHIT